MLLVPAFALLFLVVRGVAVLLYPRNIASAQRRSHRQRRYDIDRRRRHLIPIRSR
jgi:hypothetical protein